MLYFNAKIATLRSILAMIGCVWLLTIVATAAQTEEQGQTSPRVSVPSHSQAIKLFDSIIQGPPISTPNASSHPTRLIVRFIPTTTAAVVAKSHLSAMGALVLRSSNTVHGLTVVQVAASDKAAALAAYLIDPNVMYAEVDHVIEILATPNDPRFVEQWGLLNSGQDIAGQIGIPGADIRATRAWDFWTGDPDFRIAVIDTGIDLTHPDLAANIWTNPGEIPNNGLDDDLNGWIDDVHGYDFFDNDGDPTDENGHGTHVSGTIGAVGNNGIGVAGVNWQCKLVALRIFGADGSGFVSDAIEAFDYITANGLTISNNSWGTTQFSQALEDVISAAQSIDHLVIAAAGNSLGLNIDVFPTFPASLNLPNIVAVAGTANDDVALFATNIGPKTVDLGAPGESILSTEPGSMYGFRSGTSMSTAFVTGVAALLRSRLPALSSNQIIERLRGTVRPIDALQGRVLTGGVVNAAAATADCNDNGITDDLDILAGTSLDCDGNSLPDDCQPDCNMTNSADSCDISNGISLDCNGNGVPDECDLSSGSSLDCNTNGIPDECDLSSGQSPDLNMSNIPDECETCTLDSECQDSNPCTDDLCVSGLCETTPNTVVCDDGEVCTENDKCTGGVCHGDVIATIACAPQISVLASGVNGTLFPGGPRDVVTLSRGDRVTIEIFASEWMPRSLLGYNLVIPKATFLTGSTGKLELPSDLPAAQIARIEELRGDYLFNGLTTITSASGVNGPNEIVYIDALLFADECPGDSGDPKYLATLVVDVSDTASGIFSVCLDTDTATNTILVDCDTVAQIIPLDLHCLTIEVPLSGCDTGVDCNGNGIWDVCDVSTGFSVDCNRNDVPDDCELTDGSSMDCNLNNSPDECDIAIGVSGDCTGNGVPDECEIDCNLNSVADSCDLLVGTSQDCNANLIPDECEIFFVKADALGNNDGSSWENAFTDLNDGIASAQITCGESQIWVASGIYTPIAPGGSRVATFNVPSGKRLLGGFAGHETNPDQRNPIANPTVLSGDISLDDDATQASRSDNAFHVIRAINVSSETILDGFIVTGGAADGVGTASSGGGLFMNQSKLLVLNCQFLQNTAATDGAAVYIESGNPKFFNCTFTGNRAGRNGGAIRHMQGLLEFTNCTFSRNNAGLRGGGIASFSTTGPFFPHAVLIDRIDIINSILWGNTESDNPVPTQRTQIEADSALVFFSCVQGLINQLGGFSNIRDDPLFIDDDGPDDIVGTLDDNLQLIQGSPCIDAGVSLASILPPTDIEGGPRVRHCRADMGAHESLFFVDCNMNNLADGCEAMDGSAADCNQNLVPDECEEDCNTNGIADQCDIDSNSSSDCNGNDIPDECEPDCNGNGIVDECELSSPDVTDCNANGVPDQCDLQQGSPDCNNNLLPDECDALSPASFTSDFILIRDIISTFLFDFSAPFAASDVSIRAVGRGNYGSPLEFLTISLNGTLIGRAFETSARECSSRFDIEEFVLTKEQFNSIVPTGDAVLEIVPSPGFDNLACGGTSSVVVRIDYSFSGPNDCDRNLVPDVCQLDSDMDGVIDACDDCPNDPTETVATLCGCGIPEIDSDGDSIPDCLDRCPSIDDNADYDGNGIPDCAEAIPTVSDWGIAILALMLLIIAKISQCKWRHLHFTTGQ